ncbi:glycoside hydrolase family 70 protein [Paenibacillus beijingensis]|uniref:glycoside hydrolase family 70 protein n=1 Tax=Paenibacillus beijingensis TaxID=1126833 RepID=UPI0006981791|nr:glycoside hydrolase family 70 protein [Paenibacillus beijingensis]
MTLRNNWMKVSLSLSLLAGTAIAGVAPANAAESNAKGFVSNAELDKHVIFQSFSLYQPYEKNMYNILGKNSAKLKDWGITDIWMPPAYRTFSGSYYGEGYAISDRYDLGEFPNGLNGERATKYGTSDELKRAIKQLHSKDLNVQVDLVPNQMMGFPKQEIVNVTAVDSYGNEIDPAFKDKLVPLYTKGGGPGQAKYGLIKEWSSKYFNGGGPMQMGSMRIMVDAEGKPYRYFGPDHQDNYLPEWLASSEAQKYGKINHIDNYLTVDSYFAVKGANTDNDQVWRSLLLYYVDPQAGSANESYLDFMRKNGFEGATDDEVREKIIAADSAAVTKLTDSYINAQPGYSAATDPKGLHRYNNGVNGNVNQNVLQYEFLVGTDIDNSNPTVQAEQLNWVKFLIDKYGFDGFRIDAASHYNTKILTDMRDEMSSRFGDDLNNHLSYIESYTDNQLGFENSTGNGQLVYDHGVFGALRDSLGKEHNWRPLSDIVTSSYVNRANPDAKPTPNWSFVMNHDQEHNGIKGIPLTEEEAGGTKKNTVDYEKKQFEKYYADMVNADKKYANYNVPSQYAYLLTNKDTVPTVYYGDMFKSTASYMSEKTQYFEPIVKLLQARQKYVSGDQKITYYNSNTSWSAGWDLLASVRFGTSRDTGVATVIGSNPNTQELISVDMGKLHANQTFEDVMGFNTQKLTTDENGVLTVPVKGVSNPLVHGYLGVWVPSKEKGGEKVKVKGKIGVDASVESNTESETKTDGITNGHEWQQQQEAEQLKKWNKALRRFSN